MAAQLLPPIDLTGEPTVWAFQELQFFDGMKQVWRRDNTRPQLMPGVVRIKVSDASRWDPRLSWPIEMARGGYRARLFLWGNGRWTVSRTVEAYPADPKDLYPITYKPLG